MKILVPIDFSDYSQLTIEQAIKYAKMMDASIFILHVASSEIGFVIGDVGFQYLPELEDAGMKKEVEDLKSYAQIVEKNNISCDVDVKQGSVLDVILKFVDEKDIDLIIMGSRGRGSLLGAILGSVSKDIIKKSTVPVMMVPH